MMFTTQKMTLKSRILEFVYFKKNKIRFFSFLGFSKK
jgi:hypothetical protein